MIDHDEGNIMLIILCYHLSQLVVARYNGCSKKGHAKDCCPGAQNSLRKGNNQQSSPEVNKNTKCSGASLTYKGAIKQKYIEFKNSDVTLQLGIS